MYERHQGLCCYLLLSYLQPDVCLRTSEGKEASKWFTLTLCCPCLLPSGLPDLTSQQPGLWRLNTALLPLKLAEQMKANQWDRPCWTRGGFLCPRAHQLLCHQVDLHKWVTYKGVYLQSAQSLSSSTARRVCPLVSLWSMTDQSVRNRRLQTINVTSVCFRFRVWPTFYYLFTIDSASHSLPCCPYYRINQMNLQPVECRALYHPPDL